MSFPSLGVNLGSVGGTRRVTARVRQESESIHLVRRCEAITEWIHPEVKKALKAADAAAKQKEKEKKKDAEARAALAAAGTFVPAPASTGTRNRSDSKSSGPTGPLPTPSITLLASYVPGRICTLNRKVGKIVFVGYLSTLEGCWVCLCTYRAHGVGRKAVFDFNTVKQERRGDFFVPIAPPPAPDAALRIQVMGIGLENYDENPCEVDGHHIAKAQREAMRLLGASCPGDHAVFVRVEDPRPGDIASRTVASISSSSSSSSNEQHLLLLPAIGSARGKDSSMSSLTVPQPSSSSTTPVPTPRKERRKKTERAQGAKEGAATTVNTGAKEQGKEKTAATAKILENSAPVDPDAKDLFTTPASEAKAPSHSDVAAEEKAVDPGASLPISLSPSSPKSSSFDPSDFTIESESQLPLVARKLQLTGPFAEVDALAICTPSQMGVNAYVLAKYLTTYFPQTVSTEEKKARVLFRWITAHIDWTKNPLHDRLMPGEKPKLDQSTEEEKVQNAVQAAMGGSSKLDPNEMPSVSTLKRIAREIADQEAKADQDLEGPPQTASSTTSSRISHDPQSSISSKASAFHRMDLGFGPSRKNGMRGKKNRHRKQAGKRGSNGGDDGVASFDALYSGYSSSESDGTDDVFDDDAVEAVMKKEFEKKKAKQEEWTRRKRSGEATGANGNDASPIIESEAITTESILASKSTTPYGFAILFQALAAIAGLECLVLRGLLKYGPDHRKRTETVIPNLDGTITTNWLTRATDHALPVTAYSDWNLCKIDGYWFAMDPFASAGIWDVNAISHAHPDGQFVRKFSSCYFAPAPETFVLNHFPLFVYKHTGVEHLLTSVAGSGTNHRRYRTVIGSNVSGAIQTMNRFGGNVNDLNSQVGGLAGYTTKDPLTMSALELLHQPSALQLIQPPVTKGEWDLFVNVTRLYIEYSIETYENEYTVEYGINALGSGVAGTTFQIEIEVPVWMECGVELCKLNFQEAISELQSELPQKEILTISSPTSKHNRTPSFASTFVHQVDLQTASLFPASLLSEGGSALLSPRVGVGQEKKEAQQKSYDLTTCSFAQKAVGTRLEIRSNGAVATATATTHNLSAPTPTPPSAVAAMLQRHKKIQHRTRMKIHLVFPKQGKYRAIVYCKNPLGEHAPKQHSSEGNSQVQPNPDAVGVQAEGYAGWQPLMEYSITVNQGVEDMPKRKIFISNPPKLILLPPSDDSNTTPTPLQPPQLPTVLVPPPKHIFVGFMQMHRPTFALTSIRMIASQIVCIRPWTGTWELGGTFQLQYACPKDVLEMVVVSDGRWSAFNEGGQGLIATRYQTAQQDLLNAATPTVPEPQKDTNHPTMNVDGQKKKNKAPVLHYQQGQERNVFTLDWTMPRCPELFIFFKVGMKYYLLAYFLPSPRNYIKDDPLPLTKSEERRLRSVGVPVPVIPDPSARGPLFDSRFFIPQNGLIFDYQLHYQSSAITRTSVVLVMDCLRDTDLRARLVEGWVSGRAARQPVDHLLSQRDLLSDTVTIEEVVETTSAPLPQKNAFASMPKHLRPAVVSKPSTPLEPKDGQLHPLQQRMKITAAIPSPDSIQNASSTRYFTLLIYVCVRDGLTVEGGSDAAPSRLSPRRGRSKEDEPISERMYRFAFSMHFYAGEQDQELYTAPLGYASTGASIGPPILEPRSDTC